MDFDPQKIVTEVSYLLKKFAGVVLLLMGVAGAGTRLVMDTKLAHSNGQRFVIVFVGGLFSYLVGGVARSASLSHEIISLIGFLCGMFGYSVMKYVIDNEEAILHNASNFVARLCDVVLSSVADWIKSWKNPLKRGEDKNKKTY